MTYWFVQTYCMPVMVIPPAVGVDHLMFPVSFSKQMVLLIMHCMMIPFEVIAGIPKARSPISIFVGSAAGTFVVQICSPFSAL